MSKTPRGKNSLAAMKKGGNKRPHGSDNDKDEDAGLGGEAAAMAGSAVVAAKSTRSRKRRKRRRLQQYPVSDAAAAAAAAATPIQPIGPAETVSSTSPLDARLRTVQDLGSLIAFLENPQNLVCEDARNLQGAIPVMRKIDKLVGQQKLKKDLAQLFMYLSQPGIHANEMINLCLYAGPGMGKTTLAKLLAEAFVDLGILPRTEFNTKQKYIMGTAASMIGCFIGETAVKTQAVIDRCIKEGKMLILDEAYQFAFDPSSGGNANSFSTKMLDTLNQNLSNHPVTFKVCLAGYKDQVQRRLFGLNDGLERRFSFTYELEPYTPQDLVDILRLQVHEQGLALEEDAGSEPWFRQHLEDFTYAGGDIQTLVTTSKMEHSFRVFCRNQGQKTKLSQADLDAGLVKLRNGRAVDKNHKARDANAAYRSFYT